VKGSANRKQHNVFFCNGNNTVHVLPASLPAGEAVIIYGTADSFFRNRVSFLQLCSLFANGNFFINAKHMNPCF